MWKKYWKICTAAAFLTVAGICYGCSGGGEGKVVLENNGEQTVEQTAELSGQENAGAQADSRNAESPADGNVPETGMSEPGIFVHICGEVNAPGVYELPEGSRVFEAVEAAGGFTGEAKEELLNLAEKLADGMKIVVLSKGEAESLTAEEKNRLFMTQKNTNKNFGSGSLNESGLININTASKEELMTLSGVGQSKADEIIRYREENGGFKTIEEIMKVPGIKNAGFQKIKDRITV